MRPSGWVRRAEVGAPPARVATSAPHTTRRAATVPHRMAVSALPSAVIVSMLHANQFTWETRLTKYPITKFQVPNNNQAPNTNNQTVCDTQRLFGDRLL